MNALLAAATRLGDLLLSPLAARPWAALLLAAIVFGALAVLVFKLATPQRRLAAARSLLIGRLYEALLYQADLRVILRIQGRLIAANLRYLALALPGLAALLVPLLLALPQLEARFGRRPLAVGETALVSAVLAAPDGSGLRPALGMPDGLRLESGPVLRPDTGEMVWRVRAVGPGRHELRLGDGERTVGLVVPVALDGLPALTRARHGDVWNQALHDPAGEPLPDSADVRRFAVALPDRGLPLGARRLPWLAGFTVAALAAGLALRRPLRIEF